MKKFIFLLFLPFVLNAQVIKTVTPSWVKGVANDTADVLRGELLAKPAFADSFLANINRTSINQIKEIYDLRSFPADSLILMYISGVWTIVPLEQASAITITYPDANTISFNDDDAILLDPTALEIAEGNLITTVEKFYTGTDSIHYGQDTIVVTHGIGSTPSFVSIQPMSTTFGYPIWVNVINSTTFSVKRGTTGLETISTYIKFKWMAKK